MTDADVGAAGRGRQPLACPQCGPQIAPAPLACPSCQRLVHSDALRRLAAEAERTAHAGDMSAALAAWRQALELLPPDATQHTVVSARILELSRALDSRPAATKHGRRKSTRLNSSHLGISYAVFCLKKKNTVKQKSDKLVQPSG